MKLSQTQKFLLVVGGQVILILGIILLRFFMFNDATDVFLKINPVDPRDPLRGDYVTFTYDIGEVDAYQPVDPSNEYQEGQTVYVVLNQQELYWNNAELSVIEGSSAYNAAQVGMIDYVTLNKPKGHELYIQGTITNVYGKAVDGYNTFSGFQVKYGIEEYFIPEGTGANLWSEKLDNVYAHVKINSDGRAQIEQIYKDGRKWPSVGELKGN